MQFRSKSVAETQQLAAKLAEKLVVPHSARDGATVVALEGELGAGKTTFTQAFAKALGVKENLTSPTFVLMKQYAIQVTNYKLLVHIDAYRLKDHHDLLVLGINELLVDPSNIILIEWAERVAEILPKDRTTIHLDHISENERQITIT